MRGGAEGGFGRFWVGGLEQGTAGTETSTFGGYSRRGPFWPPPPPPPPNKDLVSLVSPQSGYPKLVVWIGGNWGFVV